ncbi:MAG: helix-turn-helix transcriptional regulator [Clostridia bacterium]|nr:helix-turn-helix transcriptional regulator [Clostridia bacterium]
MRTDEDIKNAIAANIKRCRESKKISQTELGDMLGKAKTTISTWERAESMPDPATLYNLSKYFDKSLSYMYGDEPAGPDLRADELELLDNYNNLNAHGQEHVRTLARASTLVPEFKKDFISEPAKTG